MSSLSDVYMLQSTKLAWVQVVAWHLFDTKPLTEPMHLPSDTEEYTALICYLIFKSFHSNKFIWKYNLQNSGTSCFGLMLML